MVVIVPALFLLGLCRAVSDDDLSGGNGDIQVVYAVFGGKDNFWNVTDKVSDLLKNSADGFYARSDSLRIANPPAGVSMSLVLLYNYNDHRHFFVRGDSGPKISQGLLREAARIDDSHDASVTVNANPKPEDLPTVVFAVYGVHENFWDVTDRVKKLLVDNPDGFFPHEDVMGGDPEWGSAKNIVIITDYNGCFHFFTEMNLAPKISMLTLWMADKSDGTSAKGGL